MYLKKLVYLDLRALKKKKGSEKCENSQNRAGGPVLGDKWYPHDYKLAIGASNKHI